MGITLEDEILFPKTSLSVTKYSEEHDSSDDDVAGSNTLEVALIVSQYRPWNVSEEYLAEEVYCKFSDFKSVIQSMNNFDLYRLTDQIIASSILDNIRGYRIVNRKQRFPDDGDYVNLSRGTYAQLLREMKRTINCDSNCTKNGVKEQECACQRVFSNRIGWIFKLECICMHSKLHWFGIFDQSSFEQWYNLIWG
ncbi:hypothetical protein M0802_016869 [Mischocyttarus mexicanus]|nr:hypothetical protein M0802_016869 [Mischocyttarus mexicanus]